MKYGFHFLMVGLFAILAAIKVLGGVAMSWWVVASPLLLLGGLMVVSFVLAAIFTVRVARKINKELFKE